MTSIKQIEANRLNALKSTGPISASGKRRSRCNAISHGLTAETVISAFENSADYAAFQNSIALDYNVASTTERVLVSRLASVLWRLRRSTIIETGMFELQGELLGRANGVGRRPRVPSTPDWYDEFDVGSPNLEAHTAMSRDEPSALDEQSNASRALACCFLRMSRLQYGTFELLNRYETALWRQAAQLTLILQSKAAR